MKTNASKYAETATEARRNPCDSESSGLAGVVSGAGGINPGITLTQDGMLEGGQNIALTRST